jgi:hypothetical protein
MPHDEDVDEVTYAAGELVGTANGERGQGGGTLPARWMGGEGRVGPCALAYHCARGAGSRATRYAFASARKLLASAFHPLVYAPNPPAHRQRPHAQRRPLQTLPVIGGMIEENARRVYHRGARLTQRPQQLDDFVPARCASQARA